MMKINELGRTMAEMMGVLAIIAVISVGGLAGYSKGIYKYKMSKMVSMTTEAIQNFAIFTKRDFSDYPTDVTKMAENAQKLGLFPDCKLMTSQIDASHDACYAPFGEIYPKFVVGEEEYTYSMNITFIKDFHKGCGDFLTYEWHTVIPEKWHKKGKVKIFSNQVSSTTERNTLNISEEGLSFGKVTDACRYVCKGASYCSIVFELKGYAY